MLNSDTARIRALEYAFAQLKRAFADVLQRVGRAEQLGPTAPGSSQGGSGGTTVIIAETTTGISARAGATPGTGSAQIWTLSGGTLTNSGSTITVNNFSAATGGIATATFISVLQDASNNYWVVSAECN